MFEFGVRGQFIEDLFRVKVAVHVERIKEHEAQQIVGNITGGNTCQPLEETQQFLLAGQFHELQHDTEAGVVLLVCGIALGEVEQGVLELRQKWKEVGGEVGGNLEQILEGGGNVPAFRPLVQHDGQDGRERQAVRLVVLDENFREVAELAQRHRGIDGALVLEEQIEKRLAATDEDGKEQVGVDLLETGFDE